MEAVNLLECIEASKLMVDQAIPLGDMLVEMMGEEDPKPWPPPEPIKCPIFTF